MDLTRLPTELVREIVDRVPFENWLASLTRVCKDWKKLCQTSRSPIKSFVIDRNVIVKWNLVLNIVSTYQVTGIYVSNVNFSSDVPWLEIVTASKQLKWLTVSQIFMEDLSMLKDPLDIERLSIVRDQYNWLFEIERLDSAKLLAKFPKVRIFSIFLLFSLQGNKWTQNAPINTEILYTSYEYIVDDEELLYTFLDNLVNYLPRLKKIVLCLLNNFKDVDIKELMQLYTTLETYMDKKGIRLIVRDPFHLVKHIDLFKEAYYKNGLPYEYYTTNNQTLFSYACLQEALETMKFLIESGITTFEKELSGAADNMVHEGYERIHTHYNIYERYPFFIVPANFVDLEQSQSKKDILDYLISLGLNCQTTGKRGGVLLREFGVAHPVVSYIILRSPPNLAAETIREIMHENPEHYQVYWSHIYQKLSKETQDLVKTELKNFSFDNVLYFIIESRDLYLIKKFVEEFNIDFSYYESTLEELYDTMENFEKIRDYVNSRKNVVAK